MIPSISIVIPVYNMQDSISHCLNSITLQNIVNFECILIDDGSTDGSFSRPVDGFDSDPRYTLIRQQHAGVSAARNAALDAAQGEFVAFVDADDVLPSNALETLLQQMTAGVDLVVGSFAHIRKDQPDVVVDVVDLKPCVMEPPIPLWAISPQFNLNTPWGKLYRRSVIQQHGIRFEEGVVQGEDRRFNLQYCACMKGGLKVISECVYHYRLGGYATNQRFIPDIAELYLETFRKSEKYLQAVEVGSPQYAQGYAYLQRCIQTRFVDACRHYVGHVTKGQAVACIARTVEVYREPLLRYDAWPCPDVLWPLERWALRTGRYEALARLLVIREKCEVFCL